MTKTLADISEAMKDIDFCTLATLTDGGAIGARPMSNNREVDYEGDSGFFTYADTRMVSDIEANPQVGVTYSGSAGFKGLFGAPRGVHSRRGQGVDHPRQGEVRRALGQEPRPLVPTRAGHSRHHAYPGHRNPHPLLGRRGRGRGQTAEPDRLKHRGTDGPWRKGWRLALATSYAVAGWFHLTTAGPFLKIMPAWVPFPELVVTATGIAELLGAAALVQPWWPALRRAGGVGLALYALGVWPANFQHMALDMARPDGGLGLAYHIPRLAAQPVLIWLALWVGGALPRQRRARNQSSLPATP